MGSKVRSAVEFSRGLGCYSKRESGMPEIGLWVLGTDDVAAPVSSFTSSTCAGPLFPPHRYPAGLSEMLNLATSCQHR